MRRTRGRPLPSGRLSAPAAGVFAGGLAAVGLALLAAASGPLCAWLGALSFVVYVAVYTPLKKVTTLCTPVGAVVGALPPLMGWAAATGRIDGGALVLAALLFVWQIPHFLAIAWLYREDYAAGGFRMLPIDDPAGDRTSAMVLLYAGALLPVSLSAVPTMATGWLYPAGAVALGGGFLLLAWRFARERSAPAARRVFLASLAYLPLLLALLAFDPTAPAAGSLLR
jgi:protoheme IX farnesyltransferase